MNDSRKHRVRRFYDEYHRQRLRTPDEYWLGRVWSRFRGQVLEIGAGRLLWNSPRPADYVIVDISAEAVKRAVRAEVWGIIADGELLPFRQNQFNLVACHDVLEHLVNPEDFLAEMCRVSRWRVLVAGPNFVGRDYAPGVDRYLPRRALSFFLGPGRGLHEIDGAHLSFDEAWQPDKDAISATNSWWVVHRLWLNGFRPKTAETWPRRFRVFNRVPLLRHLGPFMFIIAERKNCR